MNTPIDDRIVVGVDGSPGALAAVDLAAREAAVRHRPLHVVHAFAWPPAGGVRTPGMPAPSPRTARIHAGEHVEEAVHLAAMIVGAGAVSGEVVPGAPTPVLLDAARGARLLVVGAHGHGRISELATGSVTLHVITHGVCPVLVARGGQRSAGPVVVGIDGAGTCAAAVRFAAEEADLRKSELLALHAWADEVDGRRPSRELWSSELGEQAERRVLAAAMAEVTTRYPGLVVHSEVRRDTARRMLRRCSLTAQLMVVGNRGRGGFAGLLLGSVSRHLVHHAGCPTAVVRPGGA